VGRKTVQYCDVWVRRIVIYYLSAKSASALEDKTKALRLGHLKAKTRTLRGRPYNSVLEDEDSPRGPHHWKFYHKVVLTLGLKIS